MLVPGDRVTLEIEKPAAGGPMIGRVRGQIVLVGGAIPGERVAVRIDRVSKGVAHAWVVDVEEPSPDRRRPAGDPLCGGCLYAHIAYERQLAIKALVVADAFARLGKLPLPNDVPVVASPETGYRMRARLHVRGGRVGFFREGTHDPCDARSTGQLLPETADVVDRLGAALRSLGIATGEIEISENVQASERVVHVEAPGGGKGLAALGRTEGVSGLTASHEPSAEIAVLAGSPFVVDRLRFGGVELTLRRHVLSFFQGNRYLLNRLIAHVVEQVPDGCAVVDLFAGGGAFAVAAAILKSARVVAVEGDAMAAADLAANAAASGGTIRAVRGAVEDVSPEDVGAPEVVVVDPPRTGLSKEALARVLPIRARRVIYVSCDVATLARDARRLVDAGYRIGRVDGFDLFPNTPHVETVTVFER